YDASTVRYTLTTDDVVTIRIIDAVGGFSSNFITSEPQTAGIHEFNLITADLSSGTYFLTITGTRGTITIPVTVTR
ncbi:MAG TPA: hypothetical protein DIS79_06595, partial [Bacteroidetes bacterium]|nr:hypothetical protein [Bacteroidota bacterium]